MLNELLSEQTNTTSANLAVADDAAPILEHIERSTHALDAALALSSLDLDPDDFVKLVNKVSKKSSADDSIEVLDHRIRRAIVHLKSNDHVHDHIEDKGSHHLSVIQQHVKLLTLVALVRDHDVDLDRKFESAHKSYIKHLRSQFVKAREHTTKHGTNRTDEFKSTSHRHDEVQSEIHKLKELLDSIKT